MSRTSTRIILFLAFFAAQFSLTGCQPAQPEHAQQEEEVIPVKVVRVEGRTIEEAVNYVGVLKAQEEVEVYPKVSGKIIEKIKEEGSVVKRGETIAYLDRDEVGLKFEPSPVESPLDGVVGSVYIDLGESVTQQTPVALVVDMDKVKVNLEVPEKYLPRINLGQTARITVDAYPEEVFEGEVSKMSPVLVSATDAVPIEISVSNPEHRLKSGMFARVELILQRHEAAVTVLKEAVIGRPPDFYVYVIEDGKSIASSRKVSVGILEGSYCQIKSGLSVGEMVVVVGQHRLYDGAKITMEIP